MNRKALKSAYYAGLATFGLGLADCIFGNGSLGEMYKVLATAAPNGDPIGSTMSLFADNAFRLSPLGWGAVGAGAAAAYKGLEGVLTGQKKEKKEE